jgi:hypothetical protein
LERLLEGRAVVLVALEKKGGEGLVRFNIEVREDLVRARVVCAAAAMRARAAD